MKKTDLEKLYRANQHKFSEKPSREAWQRLERRLDDHYGRRRQRRFNRQHPMAMAATLLILIVMIGLITLLTDRKSSVKGQHASVQFEEIQAGNAESVKEVMEFTRRHQERLSKPIAEGEDGKKLLIAH